MSERELKRVVFHSREDGAAGHYLKKAEELLNNLDMDKVTDINDLLELYNVKLYFDNELYLTSWDEAAKKRLEAIVADAYKKTQTFFIAMSDSNILSTVENIEFRYSKSFWHLFNFLQSFKRITNETFTLILKSHPRQIHYILGHLKTVGHFDAELHAFLLTYDKAAELILTKYEKDDKLGKTTYHFPVSLSLADKESIISRYMDLPEANLNYIHLIERSRDSPDLKLSAKTRLKAKKKADEINTKILEEGVSWKVGVQITLDKDQKEPVKVSNEEHRFVVSYSEAFFDQQTDDRSLFLLFQRPFNFTDLNGLTTLVNKESEMDVLETISMKSRNEYMTGVRFFRKNQLAFLHVKILDHYLKQKGSSIEELIQSFTKIALQDQFELEGLQLNLPAQHATFVERIRIVAPELEFLLKQFHGYVADGKIDFELIEIDASPLKFDDLKSLLEKKYAYINSEKAMQLKHLFFSDQSVFNYTEVFEDKYASFYDLLQNEEVKMEHFLNYQVELVKNLIADGYLFIDSNGHVKITDDIMIYLIGELHRNEVISYWHFPTEVRDVLDEMQRSDYIRFENTLFTRQEISYFNYYLNMKGYTNGLNIRNKYLHGSNSGSEKQHEMEYYILLTLLIIALLKIHDDLTLRKQLTDEVVRLPV